MSIHSQPLPTVFVDGGGTKTALRYGDETLRLGPSALSLGLTPLMACRREARAHWGLPDRVLWVMSLAGCEHAAHREALLSHWGEPLLLMSDRDAAWLGCSAGHPMAVLTIGTGTALAWMSSTQVFGHAGGLGFVLGDEGGGAWIGRSALRSLAKALDGDTRVSLSIQTWADGLQVVPDLSAVMALTEEATPARYAARAPWVIQAARAGEPVACHIMERAVAALHQLLQRVPEPLPVALVGGLSPFFEDHLRALGHQIQPAIGTVFDGLVQALDGFRCPGLSLWRAGDV
ncbi:MAG: hypothetical protein ACO31Z_06890 [Litorivicinaceae bacterium]